MSINRVKDARCDQAGSLEDLAHVFWNEFRCQRLYTEQPLQSQDELACRILLLFRDQTQKCFILGECHVQVLRENKMNLCPQKVALVLNVQLRCGCSLGLLRLEVAEQDLRHFKYEVVSLKPALGVLLALKFDLCGQLSGVVAAQQDL